MAVGDWLVDKSALVKLRQSPDHEAWVERINRGRVRIALPTVLEMAVSARNGEDWAATGREALAPLIGVEATPRSERVAVEIMEVLIAAGLHRSVPIPDVLIASIAVVERLTVLHHDRDFDRIREIYGGPETERLNVN